MPIFNCRQVTAANINSGTATDGHVLTADGSGGSAWEAASGGGGGGWTNYVELGEDDDNITLTSSDNGTIIKCFTYYVVEETNNSHTVYLPAAEVGLQFAIFAKNPDEQVSIAVVANGGDVIQTSGVSGQNTVILMSSNSNVAIMSLFIAVTDGWIVLHPIEYNPIESRYAYWLLVVPEPG